MNWFSLVMQSKLQLPRKEYYSDGYKNLYYYKVQPEGQSILFRISSDLTVLQVMPNAFAKSAAYRASVFIQSISRREWVDSLKKFLNQI